MQVIYHRWVQKDLSAAISYYDSEGGTKLGDRFFEEAEATAAKVIENPRRFHFVEEGDIRRRASLRSFPYHWIFEEKPSLLKFLVLRHDKRHPSFGLRRR